MQKRSDAIIFTDLDGTLLDLRTCSYEAALPALRMIADRGVPLILCSSKTRAEIEHYRKKLNNEHPFIAENGGALFIPAGYFAASFPYKEMRGGYHVIELGTPYETLRKVLKNIEAEGGCRITGFGDMTVQSVMDLTGLSRGEAELSLQREYDEPFVVEQGDEQDIIDAIRKKGLQVAQARYLHILGANDKGKAVTILKGLYRTVHPEVRAMALGDSPNDLPMLQIVDVPVLVQKPDGSYDQRVIFDRLQKAGGIGPEGWNRSVIEFLSTPRS